MGGMYTYSLSTDRQKSFRAGVGLAPTNFVIWLPNPKLKDPIAWMQTTGMSDTTCAWVAGSKARVEIHRLGEGRRQRVHDSGDDSHLEVG